MSFLTVHGETPSTLWVGKIAELTDEQVNAGLKRIADMEREFPVNLTEFREACKPKPAGRRYLGTPTNARALEHQRGEPASREHIDACIANMRKLFGKAREPGSDDEVPPRPKPRMDNACTCPLDSPGTCETCVRLASAMS